jgi:hypothetical protein
VETTTRPHRKAGDAGRIIFTPRASYVDLGRTKGLILSRAKSQYVPLQKRSRTSRIARHNNGSVSAVPRSGTKPSGRQI